VCILRNGGDAADSGKLMNLFEVSKEIAERLTRIFSRDGAAVGVAGLIATGNPAGLIISTGMKVYGEESASSKVEGRAKATAKEIADVLKSAIPTTGLDQLSHRSGFSVRRSSAGALVDGVAAWLICIPTRRATRTAR
jgi:hypothetical protein